MYILNVYYLFNTTGRVINNIFFPRLDDFFPVMSGSA